VVLLQDRKMTQNKHDHIRYFLFSKRVIVSDSKPRYLFFLLVFILFKCAKTEKTNDKNKTKFAEYRVQMSKSFFIIYTMKSLKLSEKNVTLE
jgi:hypothetical protein